jgi:hypothetical protein
VYTKARKQILSPANFNALYAFRPRFFNVVGMSRLQARRWRNVLRLPAGARNFSRVRGSRQAQAPANLLYKGYRG